MSFSSPTSSAPSCPGTAAQRVQPTAQLAGTVPQPHPQRAAHAPERYLSRVLPAATQRGQQHRWRWRGWLFSNFSQLSLSSLSSQQWYLSQLSCQLGALQSIPAPRYANTLMYLTLGSKPNYCVSLDCRCHVANKKCTDS